MFPVAFEVLKQAIRKPFTNPFPVKYKPKITLTEVIDKVKRGEIKINPPIKIPEGFRGKIKYDINSCIGCQLCIKVCPSRAIEYVPEMRKIKIYISRCTFCSQCNDICPKNSLSMSEDFMLAQYEKYGGSLVIGATESYVKKTLSKKEKTSNKKE